MEPFGQHVLSGFRNLLWVSWQASVLIGLVLLIRWLFRKRMSPAWRHSLWLLVAVRLVLPWSFESPVSVFRWVGRDGRPASGPAPRAPVPVRVAMPREAARAADAAPTPATVPGALQAARAPAAPLEPAPNSPQRSGAASQAMLMLGPPPAAGADSGGWRIASGKPVFWLTVLWLAGVVVFSARLWSENRRLFRNIIQVRVVTDSQVLNLLEDCKRVMGVPVPISLVETRSIASPALFGFLRPRLLLPSGLLAGFSRSELRFVFLHELGHIKRHDILISWLMAVLQMLHWFNPLVWLAFSRMRADRELACDALALSAMKDGDRKAYGYTMLRLLENFVRPTRLPAVACLLEEVSELKTRIRGIAGFTRRTPSPWFAAAAGLALALATFTDAPADARTTLTTSVPGRFVVELPDGVTQSHPVQFYPEPGVELDSALARGGLATSLEGNDTNLIQQGHQRVATMQGLPNDRWQRRARKDAPAPRTAHSEVWTGNAVLVWGGGADDQFLNTGGIYNPADDTWKSIATNGAPAGRWFHAAVWTGTEMIIWGGRAHFHGHNHLGDGAIYDPRTDTWRPMNSQGAPSPRSQMEAAWTGTEMIIYGGMTEGGEALRDGARYNPTTDTWTPMAGCPGLEPRYDAASVWTGHELILWGGAQFLPKPCNLDTGASYDPLLDRWTMLPRDGAPSARTGHRAVWTGFEFIVWGGCGSRPGESLDSGARFSPAMGKWQPMSAAPIRRACHLAVWTGTQMIVWGGDKGIQLLSNTGHVYDPAADRWTAMTLEDAPPPRFFWRPDLGVWTGQGLLVSCGYDNDGVFRSCHYWAPSRPVYLYQRVAGREP